jgi:hypothetical protein
MKKTGKMSALTFALMLALICLAVFPKGSGGSSISGVDQLYDGIIDKALHD